MNPKLISCAFGRHEWYMYCARDAYAERNTQRECAHCRAFQQRLNSNAEWDYGSMFEQEARKLVR